MSQIEVDKVIPQSGTALQVGDSGDTITIPAGATITNNGTATGFDTDTNDKVKVSSNDTTAGFLNGKLVAGTNISLTEGSDGGNETLTAALTGTIATAQIADDAVTLAKMAPGTDGNIISYDASGNPVAVATGSAGQVLTSAGAGAPPTFADAGGGLTLIKTQTVSSNVSSVDFVNGTGGCVIDSTYEYYIVKFSGIRFDSQGGLAARIGTSGGFISASDYHQNEASLLSNGSDWALSQSTSKNSIRISDRRYTNTTAGFSISGEITFYNMSSTSLYKLYQSVSVGWGNNASESAYIIGGGSLEDNTSKGAANDRIQFLPLSASNIASGSFTLYGVKK